MEKQFNIWSVQEQLSTLSSQKQLEINLKVHRDQYINQLILQKPTKILNDNKVKNKSKKCNIL
jgi:hypothetical protein